MCHHLPISSRRSVSACAQAVGYTFANPLRMYQAMMCFLQTISRILARNIFINTRANADSGTKAYVSGMSGCRILVYIYGRLSNLAKTSLSGMDHQGIRPAAKQPNQY